MTISEMFMFCCIVVLLQNVQCLPEATSQKSEDSLPGNQKQRNVENVVQHFLDGRQRMLPEIPPVYRSGEIPQIDDKGLFDVLPTSNENEDDGFWMTWSEWSLCSRSCGGGVSMKTRRCKISSSMQSVACKGPKITYMLCNTMQCPGNSLSFREMQCSGHDYKLFRYRKFKWTPYSNDGTFSCELSCMATQYHFYQSFGIALDGTRCGRGEKNMCISGECVKVGCDMIVGSSVEQDACGVCDGNNETCFHYMGVFDRLKENAADDFNYNEVAKIPSGATHIYVKDYNQNFLALMEAGGHFERYIVNGNWVVSWPGEFKTAGTVVKYQRENDIETFEIEGPTTKDLYIMILYLGNEPQIEYEYWIPNSIRPEFDGYGELRTYKDFIEYYKNNLYDDDDDIDQQDSLVLPETSTIYTTSLSTSTRHTTMNHTTPAPNTTILTTTAFSTTKLPKPSPLVGAKHKLQTPSIKESVIDDEPSFCNPCKRPKNRKKYYCNSDFAIQARIVSKRRFRRGRSVRFDVEIITTYKSDFKLMRREYVWVPSTCCPKLRPLRSYLLMGRKVKVDITDERRSKRKDNPEPVRRYETRLVVSHTDYWSGWKRPYERAMAKISNKLNCDKYMERQEQKERQEGARKSS